MVFYAVRRALASLVVLLVATALTFMLVSGSVDPLDDLRTRQPPVPEQTIQAMRERLYLDRPVAERYWLWLTGLGHDNGDIGVLQGKWGPSVSRPGHRRRDRRADAGVAPPVGLRHRLAAARRCDHRRV